MSVILQNFMQAHKVADTFLNPVAHEDDSEEGGDVVLDRRRILMDDKWSSSFVSMDNGSREGHVVNLMYGLEEEARINASRVSWSLTTVCLSLP